MFIKSMHKTGYIVAAVVQVFGNLHGRYGCKERSLGFKQRPRLRYARITSKNATRGKTCISYIYKEEIFSPQFTVVTTATVRERRLQTNSVQSAE